MDTATASEDTVSSEDIGASEDTISSETVISDDSISAADMPEEDTRVHETPEELRWTIFTDTAPEHTAVTSGAEARGILQRREGDGGRDDT